MSHATQDLSHFAAHVDVAQAPADIQRQHGGQHMHGGVAS